MVERVENTWETSTWRIDEWRLINRLPLFRENGLACLIEGMMGGGK